MDHQQLISPTKNLILKEKMISIHPFQRQVPNQRMNVRMAKPTVRPKPASSTMAPRPTAQDIVKKAVGGSFVRESDQKILAQLAAHPEQAATAEQRAFLKAFHDRSKLSGSKIRAAAKGIYQVGKEQGLHLKYRAGTETEKSLGLAKEFVQTKTTPPKAPKGLRNAVQDLRHQNEIAHAPTDHIGQAPSNGLAATIPLGQGRERGAAWTQANPTPAAPSHASGLPSTPTLGGNKFLGGHIHVPQHTTAEPAPAHFTGMKLAHHEGPGTADDQNQWRDFPVKTDADAPASDPAPSPTPPSAPVNVDAGLPFS